MNYKALGRLKQGEMNNTEKRYAALLDMRLKSGEILWWKFEPLKLKLAPNTHYTIDFMVLTADNILEAHEVKGSYITDDAIVKFKTAAAMFPFVFRLCKWIKNKWEITEY